MDIAFSLDLSLVSSTTDRQLKHRSSMTVRFFRCNRALIYPIGALFQEILRSAGERLDPDPQDPEELDEGEDQT